MTCIVAIKTKTGVLMGADSSSVDGQRLIRRANPKLWNVSPRMAIGTAGNCRGGDLVRTAIWPTLADADDAESTLPRLFRDCWKDEIGNRSTWALVAFDREIFYVGSDASVIRVDAAYSALGSGELPALGALFCFEQVDRMEGRSNEPLRAEDARVRAVVALIAACEHVEGLRDPYVFAETIAP